MGSFTNHSIQNHSQVAAVDITPSTGSFTNASISSDASFLTLPSSTIMDSSEGNSFVDFQEFSGVDVQAEIERIMNENQVPLDQARVMFALDMDKSRAQYFIERAGSDDPVLQAISQLFDALEDNPDHFQDAISDILFEAANVPNRNASGLKLICSAAVKLLHCNSIDNAEEVIGDIFGDVIVNRIGFDSYKDPETGLVIQILKNMNWNNQSNSLDDVLLRYRMLPEHLKKYIKTIYLYDVFSPYDLFWEKTYDIADFHSDAGASDGALYVFSRAYLFDLQMFIHEAGHEYDVENTDLWGVDTDRISASQLWRDAALSDYEVSGQMGVSPYAEASYQGSGSFMEDFAESISLFYMNPSALDQYPARKALLMQYLPQDFHMTAEDGYYLLCDVLKSMDGEYDEYFYERLDAVLSGELLWGDNEEFKLIMSMFNLEDLREVDRRVRNNY